MTNHEKSNSDHTQSHHEADTTPEHERQEDPHPRIWIASLADYNNGRLHGAWVDAAQDPEGLEQAAWRILAGSPEPGAEEWAIHDYDGFGPLRLGEYESFEDISAIAKERQYKRAYKHVQNDFRELTENKDYPIQATIFDADNPDRGDEWLKDYQAAFPKDKFDRSIIGPVVGVHCGKNTIAIIWCRDIDSYFDQDGQPLPDIESAEVGEKF